MKPKNLDFTKDVKIDESSLDYELLIQADLRGRYGDYLSEMEHRKERKQDELSVLIAELDRDIRTTPEDFNIVVKLSEAVVRNTILLQSEHQEKLEELRDLEFEAKAAKRAVEALEYKKSALENLVKLHGQSYFAGPSVPRDLTKEKALKEKKAGKVDSNVAGKMKRGK